MKIFYIAKEDTAIGLSLVGIDGVTVNQQTDIDKLFDTAITADIGLLLITESVANVIRKKLDNYKITAKTPVVLEIPEETGSVRDKNYLLKFISESVGLKI